MHEEIDDEDIEEDLDRDDGDMTDFVWIRIYNYIYIARWCGSQIDWRY